MRHVLSLALRRNTISLLKSTPLCQAILLSRTKSTLPLSIRRWKEKSLLRTTVIDPILRTVSGTAENTVIGQIEPLPSTKGSNTAVLGQEKQELSPASSQEAPASVKKPFRLKSSNNPKRVWKILDPNITLESLERRTISDNRMRSYIQFITTPTSDTPGSALLLHFDDRRYIIGNAHEGLYRAGLHTGSRLLKVKDIFLTGKTEWQSKGGLMGLIISIADAATASAESKAETSRLKLEKKRNREEKKRIWKKTLYMKPGTGPSQANPTPAEILEIVPQDPTLRLHGGPNLTHMIATARSFIYRKGTPIKVFEHSEEKEVVEPPERDWGPTWSDHRIQVWAMPIKSSGVSEVKENSKPESPRKRSLSEFLSEGRRPTEAEVLSQWSVQPELQESQDKQDQQTREFAVSQMFSSTWSRDSLIEMPLRDVQMPAALHIRDPVTKELTMYEGPTLDGTGPVPDINVLVRQAWPGASVAHLPPTKRSQTAMSYIIRNHRTRGKFNVVAATDLKVPRGTLWTALAAGSSVQSSDGLTVTPNMVLGPSKEGSGVAVVDLPSSEYVHDLVNRPEWGVEQVMSGVVAVIWILGPGVVQDKSLINFIQGRPGVQNIISSPEKCPNYLSMTAASTMAIHHHQIDPLRYAIPLHSNATSGELSDAEKTLSEMMAKSCRSAKRGLIVNLEPESGVTEDAVSPYLNTDLVAKATPKDVLDLSRAARQQISTPAVQAETLGQNIPSSDAEIIFLGTGSAMPSQYRNVSATLLRVPGCGSYLMDCGENTLGQLKRLYTPPQLAELFHDLKLIWISHLHADHHLGLTSVIKAWYEEVHGSDRVKRRRPTITEQMLDSNRLLSDGKRLFVVGHYKMMQWLEEYSSVEDYGYDQLVPLASIPNPAIDTSNLEWNGTNVGFNCWRDPRTKDAIRNATGLSNLVSCAVSHCWGAQAVSLTFPTGFKFSYSGDCRPSRRFASIGRNSTVLVHEATFDDDLSSDALAKKHSTTSEAIGVGVAMGARRLILTHFSQRYQKIPSLNALDTRNIKLEDAEDIDDSSADMEQPIEEPIKPQAVVDKNSDSPDDEPSQAQAESQAQKDVSSHIRPLATTTNALPQTIDPNNNPAPRPQINDMKIGVAFDNMRVKVGDIMHLDKFTPALMELYKDTIENDEAAKEAFSDNENDILQQAQISRARSTEKRTLEEKAERARKGQIKAAKKRQESEKQEVPNGEKDAENKAGAEAMEGVEMTEPVAEKMKIVQ